MGETILVWLFMGACLFGYFIPSMVGGTKKNSGAIFVLNLFLGWTLIGWVGALIWAMVAPKEKPSSI